MFTQKTYWIFDQSDITIPIKYEIGCSCIRSIQNLCWIPIRACCTKIIFNVYFVNQTLTLGSGIHGPGRTVPSGINRFRSLLRDFVRKITTLTDKLIEPDFKRWFLRGLFQIRTIVRDIFILNPKWRETVKTILINYQD